MTFYADLKNAVDYEKSMPVILANLNAKALTKKLLHEDPSSLYNKLTSLIQFHSVRYEKNLITFPSLKRYFRLFESFVELSNLFQRCFRHLTTTHIIKYHNKNVLHGKENIYFIEELFMYNWKKLIFEKHFESLCQKKRKNASSSLSVNFISPCIEHAEQMDTILFTNIRTEILAILLQNFSSKKMKSSDHLITFIIQQKNILLCDNVAFSQFVENLLSYNPKITLRSKIKLIYESEKLDLLESLLDVSPTIKTIFQQYLQTISTQDFLLQIKNSDLDKYPNIFALLNEHMKKNIDRKTILYSLRMSPKFMKFLDYQEVNQIYYEYIYYSLDNEVPFFEYTLPGSKEFESFHRITSTLNSQHSINYGPTQLKVLPKLTDQDIRIKYTSLRELKYIGLEQLVPQGKDYFLCYDFGTCTLQFATFEITVTTIYALILLLFNNYLYLTVEQLTKYLPIHNIDYYLSELYSSGLLEVKDGLIRTGTIDKDISLFVDRKRKDKIQENKLRLVTDVDRLSATLVRKLKVSKKCDVNDIVISVFDGDLTMYDNVCEKLKNLSIIESNDNNIYLIE
jgi:hypothetical protein